MQNIKLANLSALNLSHNNLRKSMLQIILDGAFGLVSASLESLHLVNVGLELSSLNGKLQNLYVLDLSDNPGMNWLEICRFIADFNHLTTLLL
jgi:Leucine-rich repeat (LRR) protein